jgi:hypothetical protein
MNFNFIENQVISLFKAYEKDSCECRFWGGGGCHMHIHRWWTELINGAM